MAFESLTFPVGPLQCNFSLLWDTETKEAIAVDPGGDLEKIEKAISDRQLKVNAIIHTHAHFDHIGASDGLSASTKAPLYLHPGDKMLWDNIATQGQMFRMKVGPLKAYDRELEDEQSLSMGTLSLKTLHTPGHTPGSCSFCIADKVFAGDTLFQGSIGRTDLWGGDFNQISRSIKDRLYTLDPDTVVITGHGPSTKIGIERKQNAFIQP